MTVDHAVPPTQLRQELESSKLPFKTTRDLQPLQGIFGQDRAVEALTFGLQVKRPDYNIYVAGPSGTGRSTYSQKAVKERAAQEAVPEDWCYVNNFGQPYEPIALLLPPGMGKTFVQDMDQLVEELQQRIPSIFESEDYQQSKERVVKEFQEKSQTLVEQFRQQASSAGFTLQRTPGGFFALPLVGGRALKPEEMAQLDDVQRKELESRASHIETKLQELGRRLRSLEKEAQERVAQLDKNIGHFLVSHPLEDLKARYREFPRVVDYLDTVQQDIVENLDQFRGNQEEQNPLDFLLAKGKSQFPIGKYKVNLLVDNSRQKGAPVVLETNPTYYNLVGKIEYKGQLGLMLTDFSMVKAGALHRANGGYLILFAEDILRQPASWDALKKALKNKEIRMENIAEGYGLIPTAGLKPEPIPLETKVILLGSPMLFNLLWHLDEDFQKLFKVKAEFGSEMPRTPANIGSYASFIASFTQESGLRPLTAEATAKLIDFSSYLAEDQEKLSARLGQIVELICEADAWAQAEKTSTVEAVHVVRAREAKEYRSGQLEEKIREMIARGDILINTTEKVTGQVNGLSLLDLAEYRFGKPTRITARTFCGKEGLVNIERESGLSGRVHDKGVLILKGYLGGKYAQDKPLALAASIGFEQSYEEIDGDSASSAELYALVSSLAGVPLKQGIAVTGSVNQRGEIQPIGGVNKKIEGFFTTCKVQGLTGHQGVIIPRQNVKNLMLKEEIVEAVKGGSFHIYAIDHIDQGLEILTGLPAGKKDPQGNFPQGSINDLANKTIANYGSYLWANNPWPWANQESPGLTKAPPQEVRT